MLPQREEDVNLISASPRLSLRRTATPATHNRRSRAPADRRRDSPERHARPRPNHTRVNAIRSRLPSARRRRSGRRRWWGRSAALPHGSLRRHQTHAARFEVHGGYAHAEDTPDCWRLLVLRHVKQSVDAVGKFDERSDLHADMTQKEHAIARVTPPGTKPGALPPLRSAPRLPRGPLIVPTSKGPITNRTELRRPQVGTITRSALSAIHCTPSGMERATEIAARQATTVHPQ